MELTERLRIIGGKLYARRHEGVIVPEAVASIGDWSPEKHTCHYNADTWCNRETESSPVRGYLYFDLPGLMPYVRFILHSVIRDKSGKLWDITPSQANQQYPFIEAEETEEEFGELVVDHRVERIDYYVTP